MLCLNIRNKCYKPIWRLSGTGVPGRLINVYRRHSRWGSIPPTFSKRLRMLQFAGVYLIGEE
jgi:hypothetical protein